ncbi:MAG TPA: hybrid sensor histidine kinase/response regulator [Burkholderiales bacterium]|nr:hybrid sensor histidine kinase/response regulator [Burkholderiales bacterium]
MMRFLDTHASQSTAAIRGGHERAILNERIKVIYKYQPVLLAINAVVAAAMVYGLWGVASRTALLAWGSATVATLALRAAYYLAYRGAAPGSPLTRWARGSVICSGASGSMWGAAGLFLLPAGSTEYQLFILFVLMGMGAGAVSSLTAYMPAFYAFLPISLVPIGARLILMNTPTHIALGIMTFAYVLALTFFGRTISRTIAESLSLRFQNIDLVRELSEQRDEAERANVAKSKFLAAASHDLRQPLHALALFTSALDEHIGTPEGRKIVDNINVSVSALEKLFNALLDVSRLDAGVLQPAPQHFRLGDLCERLVNDHAADAAAKGLALECSRCDAAVYSDPALLERILRNYISNAIRYTDKGAVRVASTPSADAVRIEVSDTGVGVPLAQQREIFKEFYQLGNPERDRTKGLGLGLAIVDRVARLLQHPIDVRSTPGRGSCFSVTVPLGDPARVTAEAAPVAEAAGNDVAGLLAVVIDDEGSIREGMRTLLRQWGCDIVLAGSEDEAVERLRTRAIAPDAIIADYRLRDERTGVEAVERLRREFGAKIPALIITGDTAPERLREVTAGGHQLVHKPVQPAMLRAFLRNARPRAA